MKKSKRARAHDRMVERWMGAGEAPTNWVFNTYEAIANAHEGPVYVMAADDRIGSKASSYAIGFGRHLSSTETFAMGKPFVFAEDDKHLELMASLGPDARIVLSKWQGSNIVRQREIPPARSDEARKLRMANIVCVSMVVLGFLIECDKEGNHLEEEVI